jgi:hypothetical protein
VRRLRKPEATSRRLTEPRNVVLCLELRWHSSRRFVTRLGIDGCRSSCQSLQVCSTCSSLFSWYRRVCPKMAVQVLITVATKRPHHLHPSVRRRTDPLLQALGESPASQLERQCLACLRVLPHQHLRRRRMATISMSRCLRCALLAIRDSNLGLGECQTHQG